MYLQTILCSTHVCPKYFNIAVLQVCNGINIPDNYELWHHYVGSSPMFVSGNPVVEATYWD